MAVGNSVEYLQRPGDVEIGERVNSGQCGLDHFWPNPNSEKDMVTAIMRSPMRRWIWFDELTRRPHQSTRRNYKDTFSMPSEVISGLIMLNGRLWEYSTPKSGSELRRVFVERDQGIHLDIPRTLMALSAGEGSPRYEDTKKLLEAEADSANNQVIMQGMYENAEAGKPILPYLAHKTYVKTA